MAVSSDKLNLLGMLWYHGSKSQREAESCLESCSGDGCYMVREYKGLLYLSARYKDMYSHTPIPHTQQGYVLERHHNAFRTLQELISHHQKHVVYVDGGEFRLETSCHKDYSALTLKYVHDYHGPCTIQVREECIVIKRSNGKEIGRWPYPFIREFRFDDEKSQFSFTSGRRGVFGINDYLFKLHNRTYFSLRETVNRIASRRASTSSPTHQSPPQSGGKSRPPVPPHGKESSFYKRQDQSYHYDDLPIRSLGHKRSASNPDLTKELLRTGFGGSSVKSNSSDPPHSPKNTPSPTRSRNMDTPIHPSSSSPLIMRKPDLDYQVPRSASDSIYGVPRPYHDPRNDYQIPKPMDEAYMSPRSWVGPNGSARPLPRKISLQTGIEHRYEDPDRFGQGK